LALHGGGTHWIGGWVGPRAGLDIAMAKQKIPAPSGNRIPVIQHVAQPLCLVNYPSSCVTIHVWKY